MKCVEYNPQISVITATLNSERHLKQSIGSLQSQNYTRFEHIIKDGLSSDNTIDIIKQQYSKDMENIVKIIKSQDNGIYDAFNQALDAVNGDMIYFLNSDDYFYDNDVLKDVVKIFHKNPDIEVVYGNILLMDEDKGTEYVFGQQMTVDDFAKGYIPPHQGFFIRTEFAKEIGLFDTTYKLAGDFDFMLRCFLADECKCFYFNRIIAVFRLSGISNDLRKRKRLMQEKKEILLRHIGRTNMISEETENDNNSLYRKWLERLLIADKGVSSFLWSEGIRQVAIHGTLATGTYLYHDCLKEGIKVNAFIDNNPNMHGKQIFGVAVYSPELLMKNEDIQIDAIIIAIENTHDIQVKKQLRNLVSDTNKNILVLTWKELVGKHF